MIFLDKADFRQIISLDVLNTLIDYPEVEDPDNPTPEEEELIAEADELLDMAESSAMAEAEGYLNTKYLTDEIFTQTGDDRHKMVVLRVVQIALYYLHASINPKSIPDIRMKHYDDAIEWFTKVQAGEITPSGLPRPEDTSKDYIVFGSNPKRDHYI